MIPKYPLISLPLAILLCACLPASPQSDPPEPAPFVTAHTVAAGTEAISAPDLQPDGSLGSTLEQPAPLDLPLQIGNWLVSLHRAYQGLDAYFVFRHWSPNAYLEGLGSPNVAMEIHIQAIDPATAVKFPETWIGFLSADGRYFATQRSLVHANLAPDTPPPSGMVELRFAALPKDAEPRLAVVGLFLGDGSVTRDFVVRYVELWPGPLTLPTTTDPLPARNALGETPEQAADLGQTAVTERFAVTIVRVASEDEVRAIVADIEMVPEPVAENATVIELEVRSLSLEPQLALVDAGMLDSIDSDPDKISHEVLLGPVDGSRPGVLLPGQSATLRFLLFGITARPHILVWRDTQTLGIPGYDQRYLSLETR